MKNIVTKGMLVAAVASACGYAAAATIAPMSGLDNGKRVSAQGAATGVVTTLQLNASVTTSVSHFAGDEWRLTLSQGNWASSGASGFSVAFANNDIRLDAIPTISGGTMTFTVNTATAGVQSVQCTFTSLGVVASSLTTGNVRVDFGARRSNSTAFDRDTNTAASTLNAFSVASQFGTVVVSAFNGTVDYQNAAGKGFAGDDGTGLVAGNEDSLRINFPRATISTDYSATAAASLSVVLNAESGKRFAFLDANLDGTCTADEWAATTTSNGSVGSTSGLITINSTCTQLTFATTTAAIPTTADASFVIAVGSKFASPSVGTSGATITPIDFAPTCATYSMTKGSVPYASSSGFDAGVWDSNGSEVVIPYMPVNTTAGTAKIQPVVYITNRSEVSGPATAAIRNESGVACTADLGTIAANRTVNVSTALTNAIAACYNTSDAATAAGHRVNIVITASLPSATTQVYSGFTVGGSSRVSVVNSSNGK